MADERIRSLSRDASQSPGGVGALRLAHERLRAGVPFDALEPDQQAALLEERVVEGTLAEEDLLLACWAGHPGATSIRPQAPTLGPATTIGGLAERVAGLDCCPGASALALAALAGLAARHLANAHLVAPGVDPDEVGASLPRGVADALRALASEGKAAAAYLENAYAALEQRYEDLDDEGLLEVWERHEHLAYRFLQELDGFVGSPSEAIAADLIESDWGGLLQDVDVADVDAGLRAALVAHALRPRRLDRGPLAYSPRKRFSQGDTIVHPKFGEGTVERVAAKQVHVAFASGTRKLAHGLG